MLFFILLAVVVFVFVNYSGVTDNNSCDGYSDELVEVINVCSLFGTEENGMFSVCN